jgi:hypothetical protein
VKLLAELVSFLNPSNPDIRIAVTARVVLRVTFTIDFYERGVTNHSRAPVRVQIDRKFYTKLERMAEKLGTTPDVLINNAFLLALKRFEER